MTQATLFDVEPLSEAYIPRVEREIATLRLYADGRGRIPDEAAYEMARDFLEIRPACAILHRQKLLRETGVKRKARKGQAWELVITPKGSDVLALLDRAAA